MTTSSLSRNHVAVTILVGTIALIAGLLLGHGLPDNSKPTSLQPTPTPMPTFVISGNVYNDKTHHFSFRFPAGWEFTTRNDFITFELPLDCFPCGGGGGQFIDIYTLDNQSLIPLQTYAEQHGFYNYKKESILSKLPFEWMVNRQAPGADQSQSALIYHENLIVEISCQRCSDAEMNKYISSITSNTPNTKEY